MITVYFMRHGQTLYFQDMLTNAEKNRVRKGPFHDLTKLGIENVQNSARIIAKEIGSPVFIGSSPALRALGTANEAAKVFLEAGVEIVNYPNIRTFQNIRNYDQKPPETPAEIAYPELFIQSLTQETLNLPDSDRFNGVCLEGRYQSSRRALKFLKRLLEFCRKNYNSDLTLFFAGHSESFGPLLEQFLQPPLPLESFPRTGISNEGLQRAQYFKIIVDGDKNDQPEVTTVFRGVRDTILLDDINTTTPFFDNVYKDKGFKSKDK
jgi:broad specificity phosphatase PhoE